jgi:hypothetical protein
MVLVGYFLSPALRALRQILMTVPGVACFALTPGYCVSRLRREEVGRVSGTRHNAWGVTEVQVLMRNSLCTFSISSTTASERV